MSRGTGGSHIRRLGHAIVLVCALSAPAALYAQAPLPSPSVAICQTQIRRAEAGAPAKVEPGCWRIGPLVLGMSRADVARVLGPADLSGPSPAPQGSPGRHYATAVYVFPRDLTDRLARRPLSDPTYKLLELSFADGRLAAISTAPPVMISGSGCKRADATSDVRFQAERAPSDWIFDLFAGLKVGDDPQILASRFGAPIVNSSKDDYQYFHPPMAFAAWDAVHINGFSIAADQDARASEGVVRLSVTRDPATCLVTGVRVLPGDPRH